MLNNKNIYTNKLKNYQIIFVIKIASDLFTKIIPIRDFFKKKSQFISKRILIANQLIDKSDIDWLEKMSYKCIIKSILKSIKSPIILNFFPSE